MLAKKNRLTTEQFKKVFQKGEVIHTPLFMARKMFSIDRTQKVSVVVSKKIAKKAVDRNKWRRQVYSLLEKQITSAKNNIHIIIFLKKDILKLTQKEAIKQLQKYLNSLY